MSTKSKKRDPIKNFEPELGYKGVSKDLLNDVLQNNIFIFNPEKRM